MTERTEQRERVRVPERYHARSEAYTVRVIVQSKDSLDPSKSLEEITGKDLEFTEEKAEVLNELSRRANRTYWKRRAEEDKRTYTYEEQLQIFDTEWHNHARQKFESFKQKSPEPGRRGPSFEKGGDYAEYKFLKSLGIDLADFDVRKFREDHFSEGRDIYGFIEFIKTKYPPSPESLKIIGGFRTLKALEEFGQIFDVETGKDLSELVYLAYSNPDEYAKKVTEQRGPQKGDVKSGNERIRLRKIAEVKYPRNDVLVPPTRPDPQPITEPVVAPDQLENQPDDGEETLDQVDPSRDQEGDINDQQTPVIQLPTEAEIAIFSRSSERAINDRPYVVPDIGRDDFGISLAEALLHTDTNRVRVAFEHTLKPGEDGSKIRREIEGHILRSLGIQARITANETAEGPYREWVFRVDILPSQLEELRERLEEKRSTSLEKTDVVEKKDPDQVRAEVFKGAEEWTADELTMLARHVKDMLRQEKADDLGKVCGTLHETLEAAGRENTIHAGNVVIIPRSEKEREMIILEGINGDVVALDQVLKDTRYIERILDENIPDPEKPLLYLGGGLINVGNENVAAIGAVLKLKSMKEFSKYIVLTKSKTDEVTASERDDRRFVPRVTEQLALLEDPEIDEVIKNMRDNRIQQLLMRTPLVATAVRGLIASIYKRRSMQGLRESIRSIPELGPEDSQERRNLENSLRFSLQDIVRDRGPELPVTKALDEVLAEMPEFIVAENGFTAVTRYSDTPIALDALAGMTSEQLKSLKDASDLKASEDIQKFVENLGGSVAVVPVAIRSHEKGRTGSTNPSRREVKRNGEKVWRLLSSGGALFGPGKGQERSVLWENKASGTARREPSPHYGVIRLDQQVTVVKPGEHIKQVGFPQLHTASQ